MPEYKRRIAQTNIMDIDPDRLTPEQLDMIAERLSQKATGENPEAVADVKRRPESGETVTVATSCQDVTDGQAEQQFPQFHAYE